MKNEKLLGEFPGSVELQLLAKDKTKSWSSSVPGSSFTSSFGHPEEWHMGQNLPHRNSKNLIQSITFRLDDSLPQEVLDEIEEKIKTLPESRREVEKRKRYEKWVDKGLGCCALAKPEMAQVFLNALQYHDGDRYDLIAWSIMPNHVHVLIIANSDLRKIVRSWKSFTAKWAFANNIKYGLGIVEDAKRFWLPDHWDRFIRDRNHFENALNYILDNPKNAGLPITATAHRFTGSAIPGMDGAPAPS